MTNSFLEAFVGENSVIWHLKGAFYLGNKEKKKRAVLDHGQKHHMSLIQHRAKFSKLVRRIARSWVLTGGPLVWPASFKERHAS